MVHVFSRQNASCYRNLFLDVLEKPGYDIMWATFWLDTSCVDLCLLVFFTAEIGVIGENCSVLNSRYKVFFYILSRCASFHWCFRSWALSLPPHCQVCYI